MISVTKLDGTFPVGQFPMDRFVPLYRMERNTNGGGAALYVKKDIPSRQISLKNDHKNIEHFFCWNQPPQKKVADFMFI